MQETHQHTPEIMSLLIQIIPAVTKGKRDVILFFKGAGVPLTAYKDLEDKVLADPSSIMKHEIARTVLTRINDMGAKGLETVP